MKIEITKPLKLRKGYEPGLRVFTVGKLLCIENYSPGERSRVYIRPDELEVLHRIIGSLMKKFGFLEEIERIKVKAQEEVPKIPKVEEVDKEKMKEYLETVMGVEKKENEINLDELVIEEGKNEGKDDDKKETSD